MKVFVAGASGVIGRPLVRQLVAAGHDVVGMTSRETGTAAIADGGGEPVVCDALDADAVKVAVGSARPDVVVNELTKLPRDYDTRNMDERFYAPTNRIRTEGGGNLLDAAIAAGAQRFVTQSIAFLYAPEGEMVKDEDGRPSTDAPAPFGDGVRAMVSHERAVLEADGIQGLVLRYGWFYGPGTYYAADGSIAEMVRKRRFPVLGGSDGLFSFIHIDDAAGATAIAVRAWRGRHLQHHRRRARNRRPVAAGVRRGARREAAVEGAGLHRPPARRHRRPDDRRPSGRVQCEGEERAGLGAALPQLARRISTGSWIG